MDTATVAQIDAQLFTARWGLWHARSEVNLDHAETAMAAVDALLDRRYALSQAAPEPALSAAAAQADPDVTPAAELIVTAAS